MFQICFTDKINLTVKNLISQTRKTWYYGTFDTASSVHLRVHLHLRLEFTFKHELSMFATMRFVEMHGPFISVRPLKACLCLLVLHKDRSAGGTNSSVGYFCC